MKGDFSRASSPPPSSAVMETDEDQLKEKADRQKKAELAHKRRAHLMNQMKAMQKSFIRQNPEFFKETSMGAREERTASLSSMDTAYVQYLKT